MEPRVRSGLIAVVVAAGLVATVLLLKNRPDARAKPEPAAARPVEPGGTEPSPATETAAEDPRVDAQTTAPDGAQREAPAPPKRPERIGGMTPAEIVAYAREMQALYETPAGTGADAGAVESTANSAWAAQMAAKYSELNDAQAAVHMRNLEAILHWQSVGPFLSDDEILPKPLLEMYSHELLWLRER